MTQRASQLRIKLHETTRNTIIDAVVAQHLDTGAFDLTYFAIARRAGVSVRTIYRHFPTRDELLDELSRRVNVVMGVALRELPRTREGTVATTRALFTTFDQHAALVAAQIQAGLAGKVRARARHKRVSLVETVFAAVMPNLPPDRRRAGAGLIAVLLSANTWARLRDEVGLDGTRSGDITAWAIDTLWRALEIEDRKARG
jgi:AcrR family transcriptional regulator